MKAEEVACDKSENGRREGGLNPTETVKIDRYSSALENRVTPVMSSLYEFYLSSETRPGMNLI